VRALTHARVDAAAGLPPGSTSNHFRTRAALLTGVVRRIAEAERADFGTAARPNSPDDLVTLLTAMVEAQTTVHAVRTRARYALFLESHGDDAVQAPLRSQREGYEQWMRTLAAERGMPQPADAARAIMACAEGLILHRLTVDPDASVEPSLARVVQGCL
jgi:AcrR family transcriptional regulator